MESEGDQFDEGMMQFVTFSLGHELYGVPVDVVDEVIHMQFVADVPGVPDYVEGITNLRGNVVPVVNLRWRLGLPPASGEGSDRLLVVEHNRERIGLEVDTVREVVDVAVTDIEPPSPIVSSIDSDLIQGLAKTPSGFVILLDLDRTLGAPEASGGRQALGPGRAAAALPPAQ